MELNIFNLEINKLTAYKENAKLHPEEQVNQIAASIREFGFNDPIAIWGDNNLIIEGHGRLLAAEKLNIKSVPCIRLDHLTDEQRRAYTLAHNQTTMTSGFNITTLENELAALGNFDMSQFGFDIVKFDEEQADEDNYELPDKIEPRVKLGNVWQLGRHKIICGDSTDSAVIEKLMNGAVADLVVTDPPYNVDYKSKQDMLARSNKYGNDRVEKGDFVDIENDKMQDNDFFQFLEKAFLNISKSLKCGGVTYIFHSGSEAPNFITAFKKYFKFSQTLIWVKHHFVLGKTDYHWRHEPILYGWKEGAAHYFVDDRTQSTVFEDTPPEKLRSMKKDQIIKYCEELIARKQDVQTTVLNENQLERCDLHPTMKPIKLLAKLIKNSSNQNQIILDPFGGSGSTLIACEQLDRICYMAELDEKYATVILERWEKLTGQSAVKLSEGNNGTEN